MVPNLFENRFIDQVHCHLFFIETSRGHCLSGCCSSSLFDKDKHFTVDEKLLSMKNKYFPFFSLITRNCEAAQSIRKKNKQCKTNTSHCFFLSMRNLSISYAVPSQSDYFHKDYAGVRVMVTHFQSLPVVRLMMIMMISQRFQ